jgi:hypothetical protein
LIVTVIIRLAHDIRNRLATPRRSRWINERLPGWMTRPELELIADVAVSIPANGVIVEVGSFAGRSSSHWAANSKPSVAIYCIDPFDYVIDGYSLAHIQGDAADVAGRPSGELFREHTRPWASRLTMVAERSPPAVWTRSADVIFVDGDHSTEGVRRDLEFWCGHLTPRGRLLGHDWDDLRVREAVQAFADRERLGVVIHPQTNIWELVRQLIV